jgi:protoporphyrin/coproporphyrin ferrochelatase
MAERALLLINLGSPDSTEVSDVRRYLKQFLNDPWVVDINAILRWIFLTFIILPFRPKKSAEAYKKIWTPEGSPLVVHTKAAAEKLQKKLGDSVYVDYAMRYQNPSIKNSLDRIRNQGLKKITVLPLFPQYSTAATESAAQEVLNMLGDGVDPSDINILDEFYGHPAFIKAFAEVGRTALNDFEYDKILFSFHGIPMRQCIKVDVSKEGHCFKSDNCCDKIDESNKRCYRAQCYATANLLAASLNLPDDKWEVSFQSRMGRDPWIQPFSDHRFEALPGEGVKRLAVYSPSFVADCLETLEEIEIRAKEQFVENGGEDLKLIPSLNSSDLWIDALAEITSAPQ